MLRGLRRLGKRLRFRAPEPEDFERDYRRPVSNLDAAAAASLHHHHDLNPGVSGYPPGYVKSYDEGRPRK
jgi:hypothetical protein